VLSEYWNKNTSEKEKLMDWVDLVTWNSKSVQRARHLELNKILKEITS
jgi:hypothetical protein